jgi:hypothetical protein
MTADIEIKFDKDQLNKFNSSMLTYAIEMDKSMDDVVVQWAGRLAEEMVKETAPLHKGSAETGLTKDAQRAGEIKLEGDLMRAVTPAKVIFDNESTNNNKTLKRMIRRKEHWKFREITEHMPKLKNWRAIPFDKTAHTDVRRAGGRYGVSKSKKVLTFDNQKWSQYATKEKKQVGWLKASWAIAAMELGRKIPAWITRHLGSARGGVKIDVESDQKEVRFFSDAPSIKRFTSRYNHAMGWIAERMLNQMKIALSRKKR